MKGLMELIITISLLCGGGYITKKVYRNTVTLPGLVCQFSIFHEEFQKIQNLK